MERCQHAPHKITHECDPGPPSRTGADTGRWPAMCIGNLPKSASGTLEFPVVSEEGRKFLAGLLLQLSDAQLHDLFEVARFSLRSKVAGAKRGTTSEEPVTSVIACLFRDHRGEAFCRTSANGQRWIE